MKTSANIENKQSIRNRLINRTIIILLLIASLLWCLTFTSVTEKQFAEKHLKPQPTATPDKEKDEPDEEIDEDENAEDPESPAPNEKKRALEEMEELTPEEIKIAEHREKLSTALAKQGFDLKREKINNDIFFLKMLETAKLPINFEQFAKKSVSNPEDAKRIKSNLDALKREFVGSEEFLHSYWVKKYIKHNNAKERINDFRGLIAVELTRRELLKKFPKEKGFLVLLDVDVHYESPDEPGKPSHLKATDFDIAVFQTTETSRQLKVVHLEQIKSGETDTNGLARQQMKKGVVAVLNRKKRPVLLVFEEKNVLNVDIEAFENDLNVEGKINQITRGVRDKPGFTINFEFSAAQFDEVAIAVIDECFRRGIEKL